MVERGKPDWLRVRAPTGDGFSRVRELTRRMEVRTVCDSSHCPNISDCWSRGNATFMILGSRCTRNCSFCAVEHGRPDPVDAGEPERVAAAVKSLGLRHVVITSVTRDDLPDQGAGQFCAVVRSIRALSPETTVELLVPDMQASREDIRAIADVRPNVLGHNIETVERLQRIRDKRSSYQRSLDALQMMSEMAPDTVIKSSLMLGLGETRDEVLTALGDLRRAGATAVAIGQYLRPANGMLPVAEYVRPEAFAEIGEEARSMGFMYVSSAPLVRSSFNAHEVLMSRRESYVDR